MIHIYWHEEHLPQPYFANVDAWSARHEVRFWTPDDLPVLVALVEDSHEGVKRVDWVRHQANAARWWILTMFGGVWADADVTPLRNLPPELENADKPWSAGFDGTPTPFMCGGPAHHIIWARAQSASLDWPKGSSPEASGGRMLARVAPELRLLPMSWFADADAAGHVLPKPYEGRYTTHEWATSSRRHAGQ